MARLVPNVPYLERAATPRCARFTQQLRSPGRARGARVYDDSCPWAEKSGLRLGASRVGLLGVAGGRALLIDDEESLVRKDHALDPRIWVAREDNEVIRLGADRLVLVSACPDLFVAVSGVALAEVLHQLVVGCNRLTQLFDPLVDIAEEFFVLGLGLGACRSLIHRRGHSRWPVHEPFNPQAPGGTGPAQTRLEPSDSAVRMSRDDGAHEHACAPEGKRKDRNDDEEPAAGDEGGDRGSR